MKVYMGRYPKNPDKNQTVRVEIHPYDVWSMYTTLAEIIHPMLVMYRKENFGCPIKIDDSDVPESYHSSDNWEKWNYIIEEMIHAFEKIKNDDWEDEFRVWNENSELVSSDDEAIKKEYERINNGLRLFAKYYFSLWI